MLSHVNSNKSWTYVSRGHTNVISNVNNQKTDFQTNNFLTDLMIRNVSIFFSFHDIKFRRHQYLRDVTY